MDNEQQQWGCENKKISMEYFRNERSWNETYLWYKSPIVMRGRKGGVCLVVWNEFVSIIRW